MSISYAPSPPLYLKLWAMHSQSTVGIIGSKNVISPTGNRTPVSRVTGGDTYHYTIEDNWKELALILIRLSTDSLDTVDAYCMITMTRVWINMSNPKDASTTKSLTQHSWIGVTVFIRNPQRIWQLDTFAPLRGYLMTFKYLRKYTELTTSLL